jgi:nitroreductase
VKNELNEMSVFEAILGRRSIREYTSQKVDAKKIRSLIEAAVMAPTAMHREPWAFAVIQDTAVLQELSDVAKPMFIKQLKHESHDIEALKNPDFNLFYDANTLIIICGDKNNPAAEADCWLAAENLILAAFAMGLGTCVIGSVLSALKNVEQKLKLGINDTFEVFVPIVIGFPRGDAVSSKRKRPLIVNWLKTQSIH